MDGPEESFLNLNCGCSCQGVGILSWRLHGASGPLFPNSTSGHLDLKFAYSVQAGQLEADLA